MIKSSSSHSSPTLDKSLQNCVKEAKEEVREPTLKVSI